MEIAGEQRVRGAVERRYRLRQDRASVSPETFKSASREDHRRAFAAAMAALLAEFNAYLDHDDADPPADQVGYQQRGVWLTRDELLGMITGLRHAIAPPAGQPGHTGSDPVSGQPDPVPGRKAPTASGVNYVIDTL